MKIDNEFNIGDLVYLKTDEDQKERMVTSIIIRPGSMLYSLCISTIETNHYAIEISGEKDIIKTLL